MSRHCSFSWHVGENPPTTGAAFSLELPLRINSLANARQHWTARHKSMKAHRKAMLFVPATFPLPCVVKLTRIAPRALDGHDNLASAFKGCVDGIAARLGVPDNDPRITWQYAQERGVPKYYGIRIEVEAR